MCQRLVDGGWRRVGNDVAALSTVGAVSGQWCGGLVDRGCSGWAVMWRPYRWWVMVGLVDGGWQWVGSDILGPPPTRVCERGCWVTVEGRERFFLTPLLEVSVLSPVRCWCNLVVSRKKTGGRWHLPACRACLPSLSPLLWTSPNGSSVFIVGPYWVHYAWDRDFQRT